MIIASGAIRFPCIYKQQLSNGKINKRKETNLDELKIRLRITETEKSQKEEEEKKKKRGCYNSMQIADYGNSYRKKEGQGYLLQA